MTSSKSIFYFGKRRCDGDRDQVALLGGKGAQLAEMTRIGMPVPPGFTISTKTCQTFFENGKKLSSLLKSTIHRHIRLLEQETNKTFGATDHPLLLSVRSGAAISMPGMMDSILNLGMNDRVLHTACNTGQNERAALDSYRRLINMFGDVVMGIEHNHFETEFTRIKKKYRAKNDIDLEVTGLSELVDAYKHVYKQHTGKAFPQDPYQQLELSIEAIFNSWYNPRAISYRRINQIDGLHGTAVNVQSMVFGNKDDQSATGVAFTRDPATGNNSFFGEFLINAQGEDVVAGIRTPRPIIEMKQWQPDLYRQLVQLKEKLERHYQDMQDIEFTVESGTLYLLQTRRGKRTGIAAVKLAVDMAKEKLITIKQAILRVPADDITQCLLPSFIEQEKQDVLTRGLPASPGAATGIPVFDADEAVARHKQGDKVILVQHETSPEAIEGMQVAQGILTSTGGTTSHAAVVARGWGKCCVTGASEVEINANNKTMVINGTRVTQKNVISIDGSTGEVMLGEITKREAGFSSELRTLMKWVDKYSTVGVRANADSPKDAMIARQFGATGIGLCRTEHMFFGDKRTLAMREMILAADETERRKALKKLLPYQRRDFEGLFKAMHGMPVTIRLIDPPLHEFIPHDRDSQHQLAHELGLSLKTIQRRVEQLHETNPMLGHRGCRLVITYPEIMEMQVQAITEAAINTRKQRIRSQPEIMVPLVGIDTELSHLRTLITNTIAAVKKKQGYRGNLDIPIGTMIEIPRAAITADQIAGHADFFSFGTNDLTQMTLGFSRDDFGSFMPDYLDKQIYKTNPFKSLDSTGVGQLVSMAVKLGKQHRKKLKCGICGEHGGDPASIRFFVSAGLDYVSCSPFRVPVARLAVAQAALSA